MYALVKRPVTVLTLSLLRISTLRQKKKKKKSAVFLVIVFAFVGRIYHSLVARQLKIAVNVNTFSSREDKPGPPNDRFLLSTLKTLFRLSRVLVDI